MTDIHDIQTVIDYYIDERVLDKQTSQTVREAERRRIVRLLRNIFKDNTGHTYYFKKTLFNALGANP